MYTVTHTHTYVPQFHCMLQALNSSSFDAAQEFTIHNIHTFNPEVYIFFSVLAQSNPNVIVFLVAMKTQFVDCAQ